MRTKFSEFIKLAVLLVSVACAAGSPPGLRRVADRDPSAAAVVSGQELASATGSLFEALERLRPWYVAPRLASIFVTIDDSPPTDLSILKTIPAATVYEVQLLRSSSAVGRVAISETGAVILGDIIAVVTRQATRQPR